MAKSKKDTGSPMAPRISNRKARHDYHIHESMECGLMLRGAEVKSVRLGRVSLAEAFARIEPATRELWLFNMDIAAYANAPSEDYDPKRKRKLLLHRRQLNELLTATLSKGMTLVPLTLYFNDRGMAKIELAVASGKGKGDKRESMKKQDAKREMRKAMTRDRIG